MKIPEELLQNLHFNRYYRTWQSNPVSIVFIPLAQICREYGFLDQAREICESGLIHHPHSVSARLMLAQIFLDLEKLKEARKTVEKILEEFPGQHEALKLCERLQEMGGKTKSPPKSEDAGRPSLWDNVTMARIYASQGEKGTARKIVEKILTRNPQDPNALALRQELSS